MKVRTSIERKYFPQELQNQAINLLIYGLMINKVKSGGQSYQPKLFYINEDSPLYLQYLQSKKSTQQTRLDLTKVDYITSEIRESKKYSFETTAMLFINMQNRQLSLKFNTKSDRDLWWQGLLYFKELATQYVTSTNITMLFAQRLFMDADGSGAKQLNKKEVEYLVAAIKRVHDTSKSFLSGLQQNNHTDIVKQYCNIDGSMTFDRFYELIVYLMKKEELIPLFKKYTTGTEMSMEQLNQFKSIEQKEGIHTQNQLNYTSKQTMNMLQFQEWIFSNDNSILDQDMAAIGDMDHPISHYYINSSHNTYLTANQLTSDSSVNAYIDAIRRGCRCLELDCWDGEDGIPIIYHGYTMTSKILFEDVIIAINKFAFIYSPYPLILSLELHCTIRQQEVMAEVMMKHFGESLYIYDKQLTQLPSPNQLKGKILIKSTGTIEEADMLIRGIQNIPSTPMSPKTTLKLETIFVDQEPTPIAISITTKKQKQNNSQLKIELEYNKVVLHPYARTAVQQAFDINDQYDMILTKQTNQKRDAKYIATISLFNSDFKFDDNRPIWNISSLSEDKISKLMKSKMKELCNFTNKYLIRAYPAGTRIDSSNYDPMESYLLGIQIVALNFQTTDQAMLLNQSKFMENGGIYSGYVLKPKYLLNGSAIPVDQEITKLIIRIISCSNLISKSGKPIINTFIEISVRGNVNDERNNLTHKTKSISKNGICPFFDEIVQFDILDAAQAIIIFQVFNEDETVGQYGIPVSCIRQGYRVVPLRDSNLDYIDNSYIFVHIQK